MLGVFKGQAINIGPVLLPAPSAAGADRVALDVMRSVRCPEGLVAENATRRGSAAEVTATLARQNERLPGRLNYQVLARKARQAQEKTA